MAAVFMSSRDLPRNGGPTSTCRYRQRTVSRKVKMRIGETICMIEIPHARIAVISESADMRPKTSMTATITAHGTVKVSTIGRM